MRRPQNEKGKTVPLVYLVLPEERTPYRDTDSNRRQSFVTLLYAALPLVYRDAWIPCRFSSSLGVGGFRPFSAMPPLRSVFHAGAHMNRMGL